MLSLVIVEFIIYILWDKFIRYWSNSMQKVNSKNMMFIEIADKLTCNYCGKTYNGVSFFSKYCSPKCKKAAGY